MKQAEKIWLATAAALILVGAILFVGVMTAHHWDFSALGTDSFETNTIAIEEEFQNISIRSDTADIAFLPSEDGKCRVEFYDQSKEKHTASVQEQTLFLEVTDTRKWYDHIAFSLASPQITIYLPRAEYASLAIEESTGEIVLPGTLLFESISISASTGNVECLASSSGPIRIETSTGDIRLEGLSAGELVLSASTGRVEVRSVLCEGEIGVTVSTGRTVLADSSCKSFVSSGSTGDITLENVIAEGGISLERSTGDVRLEQCDAAELFIQTDTGDVTGSLLSEKVFITQSDTGRIQVPETTAGGKCRIITDTGDIVIAVP